MVIGTSSRFRIETLRCHFTSVFQKFVVLPPDIDEKAHSAPDPFEMTERIARAKIHAVLEKLKCSHPTALSSPGTVVVTSDQVVVKDSEVREKPVSVEENRAFLSSYSNSSVRTVAAYAVCLASTGKVLVGHDETETFFGEFGSDVVERVINRGVSAHCAGGLVVEDEELSQFVLRVVGTLDGVRGMACQVVDRLLQQLGQ
ncbi:MAF-like septum formation protein [Trypanosoma vivax]|nr:MAF-like septum formation protein [Trypanosoma vivax]